MKGLQLEDERGLLELEEEIPAETGISEDEGVTTLVPSLLLLDTWLVAQEEDAFPADTGMTLEEAAPELPTKWLDTDVATLEEDDTPLEAGVTSEDAGIVLEEDSSELLLVPPGPQATNTEPTTITKENIFK